MRVLERLQGAMASGVLSLHYSGKANTYAGKLKSIQNEMIDLGCN